MKILEVYDKNSDLRYKRKNVFETMDKFFLRFPKEYSDNYYRNLDTLKIFKVDRFYDIDEDMSGGYSEKDNILFYSNISSLGHELIHMSSYDSLCDKTAFSSHDEIFDTALLEGMTEYLSVMAFNMKDYKYYCFEAFCVSMLSNIDNIFKNYFIPDHDGFINVFSNKKDIYSLMYSLNYYMNMFGEYYYTLGDKEDANLDRRLICESIRDSINSLIDIELGYEDEPRKLELYSEKFMDLITSGGVAKDLGLIYPGYKTYANRVINKRIRSKIKR